MSKKQVAITLTSRQHDDGLVETTTQTHSGTLYDREDGRYLIYSGEGVNTQIKLEPEEVRLFRRGDMQSWQTFRLGEVTGGTLSLGVNTMVLRVLTSHFGLEESAEGGRLELHYQLWTGASGDPDADPQELSMGRFELELGWTVTGEA